MCQATEQHHERIMQQARTSRHLLGVPFSISSQCPAPAIISMQESMVQKGSKEGRACTLSIFQYSLAMSGTFLSSQPGRRPASISSMQCVSAQHLPRSTQDFQLGCVPDANKSIIT